MASKNLAVILLGALCLCTNVCWVSGQAECATDVSDCVNVAFDVFTNYPNDIPRVCKATDDFLMCIVRETELCDPLVAASIKDSMSPMIDIYTAEPYNCVLESASNDAFKPDPCSEELSACSIAYYQAESEAKVDYNRACGLFENYLGCMESNTTSCDMRTFIKEHTANATKEFDKEPLYCEERLQYPLAEVDANITVCNDILQNMDIMVGKQDYVCRHYKDFFNCVVEVLSHASPRQFQIYIEQVNEVSETFRARPYFCESDQPCMELFKACNQSAYNPSITPCQYMDVYRSCLSSSNRYCGEAEYITLATNTQIMIGELHNKYNCIEENMDKTFDETTPVPVSEDDNNNNNNNNNDNMHGDDNTDDKDDTMQNDGPVPDAEDPTPEPEHNNPTNPSKTDTKTEENGNTNNNNGGTPEASNTDDAAAEPTDGNVIVTTESEKEEDKKPQGGSKQKTPTNNGENSSTVLKGSLWMLLLTLCLMIVKPRL